MAVVAGGMIASSVLGGIASYKAAGQAADAQRSAARMNMRAGERAGGILQGYYDTTRQDFNPYLMSGIYGTNKYMQEAKGGFDLPEFQQPTEADMLVDPSYNWRLNQGMEATTRALTKSGQAWGGQRGIALMDYAQNAASQEYSRIYDRAVKNYGLNYNRKTDYLNRLQDMSSQGQNAVSNVGSIGQGYGAGIASAYTGAANSASTNIVGAGEARAAGTIGVGRALGSIANTAGNYYAMQEGNFIPGGYTASTVEYA